MVAIVLWVAAAMFLLVGSYCAAFNIVVTLGSRFLPRVRHVSPIPLIGGVCDAFGLLLIPLQIARRWFWLPLILDVGCVPISLAGLLYYVLHRAEDGQ
jgi:hypothetical protein